MANRKRVYWVEPGRAWAASQRSNYGTRDSKRLAAATAGGGGGPASRAPVTVYGPWGDSGGVGRAGPGFCRCRAFVCTSQPAGARRRPPAPGCGADALRLVRRAAKPGRGVARGCGLQIALLPHNRLMRRVRRRQSSCRPG